MVFLPVGLVLKQPDLGTAMMLTLAAGAMFFLSGVRIWKFALILAAGGAVVPVAWKFMRDYQKNRILTFLHPENDPLGAGYHITQSEIALGSGGVFGKGFMQGTQSHLNFLPEKQTDFIFTMLAEEWGMIGGIVLVGLYTLVLIYGYALSMKSRNHFGRLVGLGLTTTFFLYVFINIAMVMGLVAGGRRAAAADFLWRYGHADPAVRLRIDHERLYPPRRSHRPARRIGRCLNFSIDKAGWL